MTRVGIFSASRHRTNFVRCEEVFYPNGLSNSMPEEIQEAILRTVPGLENVKMVRPAYGVEYDFVDPRELARAYSCRFVPPL